MGRSDCNETIAHCTDGSLGLTCPLTFTDGGHTYNLCGCSAHYIACDCCWCAPPSSPTYSGPLVTCIDCCYTAFGVVLTPNDVCLASTTEEACDVIALQDVHQPSTCYPAGSANFPHDCPAPCGAGHP